MKKYSKIINSIYIGLTEGLDFNYDDDMLLPIQKKKFNTLTLLLQPYFSELTNMLNVFTDLGRSKAKLNVFLRKTATGLLKELCSDKGELILKCIEAGYIYSIPQTTKYALSNVIFSILYLCPNMNDLNWIDISKLTSMDKAFYKLDFKGDISRWNTEHVKTMNHLFFCSTFNGDISNWNTSNVKLMKNIFWGSLFAGDLSQWDVSKVSNLSGAFTMMRSIPAGIEKWNTSNVKCIDFIFFNTKISKPFGISNWNVSKVMNMSNAFNGCNIYDDLSSWKLNTGDVAVYGIFLNATFFTEQDLSNFINGNSDLRGFLDGAYTNNLVTFKNANLSKAIKIDYMLLKSDFNGDISNWDTKNVISMYAFAKDNKLLKCDISQWNLKKLCSGTDSERSRKSAFYGTCYQNGNYRHLLPAELLKHPEIFRIL